MRFVKAVSWQTVFFCACAVKLCMAQTPFTDITSQSGIQHHHEGFMYGGGIACGDFDGDGYSDLYIPIGNGLPNLLYLNQKNATFKEVAASAGVADTSEGFGAVCGDLDNDGDLDLYVTNYFAKNKLYLNRGDGTFVDATDAAGVGDPGPSTSVALADYDNDGFLDIYVLNRSQPVDEFPSTLYHNNGDGTFIDVTASAHAGDLGSSLAVGFLDYDGDGFQDIYVVNEFEPDGLYHNNRDGSFTNVTEELKLPSGQGMGVDFADYDNDGDLDIYVSNLEEDFLLQNNGDGTFSDVGPAVGVVNNTMAWGVNFLDFDNDGDRDIYVVNGAMKWPSVYSEVNVFYRNNGNGTFAEKAAEYGVANSGDGRASVCADFNNDGYLDLLFVNVLRGQTTLYRNNGGDKHWITLRLVGRQSNRSGVGARVEVVAGNLKQVSEVRAGSSYASTQRLELAFGLNQEPVVDQITVHWPSGIVQRLTNVAVNQIFTIEEATEVTSVESGESGGTQPPGDFTLFQNYPNPFNPETTIRYQLFTAGNVNIELFNLAGQLILGIENGFRKAGEYVVKWNGKDKHGRTVPSGVYAYRISFRSPSGAQSTETRKLLFMK